MKNPFIAAFLAVAATRPARPNLGRCRTPGPARPAGSKLARKAAAHMIAKCW
jgi:hypothetical protein